MAAELKRVTDAFVEDQLEPALIDWYRKQIADFDQISDNIERLSVTETGHEQYELFRKICQSFLQAIDHLNERNPAQEWLQVPDALAERLPEEMLITQQDERFRVVPGDGIFLSAFKIAKSAAVKVYPKKGQGGWKQLIRPRQVMQHQWLKHQSVFYPTLFGIYLTECRALEAFILQNELIGNDKEIEKVSFFDDLKTHAADYLIARNNQLASLEESVSQCCSEFAGILLDNCMLHGTIDYSGKSDEKTLLKYQKGVVNDLDRITGKWKETLSSIRSEFLVQGELADLMQDFLAAESLIKEKSETFFAERLYKPMQSGIEVIRRIEKQLQGVKGKKQDKAIEKCLLQLEDEFTDGILFSLKQGETYQSFAADIKTILSDLQLEIRNMSEVVELADERELTFPVPLLKIDDFKWQKIAGRYLNEYVIRKLNPSGSGIEEFISEKMESIEDASSVVYINLKAALASGEEEEGDLLEYALSGLERAENSLDEAISEVREKHTDFMELVQERMRSSIGELSRIVLTRDFDSFELRDKSLQMKEKALNWKMRVRRKFSVAEDKLAVLWRFTWGKSKQSTEYVLRFLGFAKSADVAEKTKADLKAALIETHEKFEKLPFIYQRLFSYSFEADRRLFVSPGSGNVKLETALQQWEKGAFNNIIITGEKGSGKSALIKILKSDHLEEYDVVEIHLNDTFFTEAELIKKLAEGFGFKEIETAGEFLSKIKRSKKKKVVILEDIQNAFVRHIHGYGALEAFWLILSETNRQLFWVVSCSRTPWNFMGTIWAAGQYFSTQIKTDVLNSDQVESVIMLRHKATGYHLRFEANEETKKLRSYRKIEGSDQDEQEFLKNRFFEKLCRIADGNITMAMTFWIKSIQRFEDDTIFISGLRSVDIDNLEDFSRDVLFLLAALKMHDVLTVKELSMALHKDEHDCRLLLSILQAKGLLNESGGHFSINQLVYRQISRMLEQRNIIH